ncbi:MAG TPA: CinA family protein [Candidatus Eisenbacteria bacterium]|nr:CinA family protein [Candidatus Eisenbacteria bacterium]
MQGAPEPLSETRLIALAERLQELCLERGLTVATAESSTGGLVGATITSIPGSSGYYLGGVVSYGDAAKADLLGVPAPTLAAHGAVSAQVALAMASGAQQRLGASLAVAITGIAGPDGGTDAKPVGLTYVGLAGAGGAEVRRFAWTGDRAANRLSAAEAALEWLVERAESARGAESAAGATGTNGASSAPDPQPTDTASR